MSLSVRRAWIEIMIHQKKRNPVALRKESVDRNNVIVQSFHPHKSSLSVRRAWIEIMIHQKKRNPVALRKESVDRNNVIVQSFHPHKSSLSVRRAWIEICPTCQWRRSVKVALRKESVDRNFGGVSARPLVACRSP